MIANSAMIFDFSASHRKAFRAAAIQPRVNLSEALQHITRSAEWLAGKDIPVLGFAFSTLHDPVIIAAPHPRVWMLFSGHVRDAGRRQDGALRYEVWEGFDRINQVTVRWEEVSACG